MNSSILHITNGDSTTNYLKKLQFSGDFITWREMLCEGKTTTNVGSDVFWKTRYDFFKSSYKISKQKFIDYTVKEYRKLCNKKENKQIVLWFEYDLFCQINMIAVISWLKRYRKGYEVSLVCSGKVKESAKMLAIPELSEEQIQQHFKDRIELSQDDIEYADYIWQLYCSDSPLRLEKIHQFNPMSPFKYLTTALEAHLRRFPSIENGLNNVENFVLKTANNNNLSSKNQLVGKLLTEQEVFGFGDLQYENNIDKLQKLFTSFDPVKLTRKGKDILENQANFYREIRSENSYLGGSKKYSFLYSNATEKLLQITS
ncbi:DUF1835 domain-containing protein [Polaribacter haliotis]|uniref:DUF1835 domain-containing protein n=1 Tax=Polaribacter haliotis TaxID=1888915 RepID=A0A7L8AGX3_9FLAO|nr:DUF1835 domain-containing protein [Polaribacter haliotis]QOD61227.1 DUF1835 domain-containing protein [Polaribacter haliotis]